MSIKSDQLRACFELMNAPRDFEVGDLVTWKDPALINSRHPANCNDFAIFVRFQEPLRGSDNTGSNQFSDLKDAVFGILEEDGEYNEYVFNSQRFKKFVE